MHQTLFQELAYEGKKAYTSGNFTKREITSEDHFFNGFAIDETLRK